MKKTQKKGVMSEIIGVFVLILVISVLAGMVFLFTSNLKVQAASSSPTSDPIYVNNETLTLTDYAIGNATSVYANRGCVISSAIVTNATSGVIVTAGNYTLNSPSNCYILGIGTAGYNATKVNVSYVYTYVPVSTSEIAVNGTESAGANVVNYLPLLFLAIIFGAILAVVLKIILPYINLGNQVGGF